MIYVKVGFMKIIQDYRYLIGYAWNAPKSVDRVGFRKNGCDGGRNISSNETDGSPIYAETKKE